jgi:hypothetical protein
MWCIAEMNAEYIARMEDVLALYENPHPPLIPRPIAAAISPARDGGTAARNILIR